MNETVSPRSEFYVVGGTLQRDASCYVVRKADAELLDGLRRGQFCYVLTSRQMGKSSLMVRTAIQLREEGISVAVLDLTAIGQNLTPEQWYDGLIGHIGQRLELEDALEDFWQDHLQIGPLQRFLRALREVVLTRIPGKVVIFVDEVDAVRSLPFFADEFFAGIRECYNRRTEDPTLNRLTFGLFGVASPADLIRDTRTTPFNIGMRIELRDFTQEEAWPLAAGLNHSDYLGEGKQSERGLEGNGAKPGGDRADHGGHGEKLLERILYWTSGHPYLTQRLCRAVADAYFTWDREGAKGSPHSVQRRGAAEELVDRLCKELFFSPRAKETDDNLLFVRERLLRSEVDLMGLLELYGQVWAGRRVRDDETNPLVSVLRLSGIARAQVGRLVVRNPIYRRVFDRAWIRASRPDAEQRRQRAAYRQGVAFTAIAATLIVCVLGFLIRIGFHTRAKYLDSLSAALHSANVNSDLATRQTLLAQQRAIEADKAREELQRALNHTREIATQKSRIAEQERAARAEAEKSRAAERKASRAEARAALNERVALRQAQASLAGFARAQLQRGVQTLESGNSFGLLHLLQACTIAKTLPGYTPLETEARAAWIRYGGSLERLWQASKLVMRVAFSPDAQYLTLLALEDLPNTNERNYTVGHLDLKTGQEAGTALRLRLTDNLYVALNEDGTRVAVVEGKALRIWDVRTGKMQERALRLTDGGPPIKTPNCVGFSFGSDAGRLITLSDDRLRLWDVATGRPLGPPLPAPEQIFAVDLFANGVLSADGRRFAVLPRFTPDAIKHIRVYDMITGKPVGPGVPLLPGQASDNYLFRTWLISAAFSPDGRRLAIATQNQARVWDVETGKALSPLLILEKDALCHLAFSPDGRRLAMASWHLMPQAMVGEAEPGLAAAHPLLRLWRYEAPPPADLREMRLRTWTALGARLNANDQVERIPEGERVQLAAELQALQQGENRIER